MMHQSRIARLEWHCHSLPAGTICLVQDVHLSQSRDYMFIKSYICKAQPVQVHHRQTWKRFPPKFYRPFRAQHLYSTFPIYYLLRLTTDCLITDKTKNALHNETVILNDIGGVPISHSLGNYPCVKVLVKVMCTQKSDKILSGSQISQ